MGRRHTSTSYFSSNDSNTIDDISGFKVKKSEVVRRWDGLYMVPDLWEERHRQDFPVTPTKQVIHKNVRTQSESTTAAASFDKV